ncbi:MAG: 23S rRNA (uracil(1939)-C(5))-methyltransferase RlmD [Proteobacteria bacterium]|nr:23S rRNA (uracil(1939)-C(5))-methyltransferase RlmD [Pseudomonadota bacterium]
MRSLRRGQTLEVEAGPWDPDGFARCPTESGVELRVRDVVPGERLEVAVDHVSKGGPVAWATASRILTPSPARREPPCRIHGRCGACGIQHVDDPAQLEIKAAASLAAMPEALAATVLPAFEWIQSPRAAGYRHKAVWRPVLRGGLYLLGGYARGSHDIVSLAGCGVVCPALLEAHRAAIPVLEGMGRLASPPDEAMTSGGLLRTIIGRASRAGEVLLTVVVRQDHPAFEQAAYELIKAAPSVVGVHLQVHDRPGDAVMSQEPTRRLAGRSWIEETVAGKPFRLTPLGFFQVNPDVLERVVERMRPHLEGRGRVLDLYCGGGVLGLAAADGSAEVVGIDTNAEGIDAACKDAARHERAGAATFLVGKPSKVTLEGAFDVAIVDPPRAGLKGADRDALLAVGPDRIVYLSCHGASLARDADVLMESGYRPVELAAADMFPQTPHVEWMAVFDRA